MKAKDFAVVLLVAVVILLVPFTAMQFTSEVNWTLSDFVIMGLLLVIAGNIIAFILRNLKHKILLSALVIIIFLLVWIELSVGIFGSPLAGN